jgi:hypothetical protein
MAEIRIELGPTGIRRVVVRHAADHPDQGLALLDRAMPSLTDLHARLRGLLQADAQVPAPASILIDGAIHDGVFVTQDVKVVASTDVDTAAVLTFLQRIGLSQVGHRNMGA